MLKHVLKSIIIAVVFLCSSLSVFAQVDTAFWYAVPKLCDHAHTPITLVVTTFDDPATITITKPAAATPSVAVFNVAANSSGTQVLVQNDAGLTNFECPHNTTSNYGLYIHSTAKVNAYVAVQQNNSEIYALKGKNGLGTQFFVTMQYQFDNGAGTGSGGYPQARNTAEIIATENNTTITITPSVTCGTHAANAPFTVSLNKGQVYCLASNYQSGANHLCGTTITSDKPIVVDVSDDSVTPHCSETTDNGGGSADLVADQLVPVEMAGGQYIVVPSPTAVNNNAPASNGGGNYYLDYACIFALEDNTNVTVYSGTPANLTTTSYSMNQGDKEKYHFTSDNPIFIYATNAETGEEVPIFVFQVTGAGKEFGGTQLPHIYCTGSTAVGYRPLASANNHTKSLYLTLICNASYTSGFQINGNSNLISASDWHDISGAPSFKFCRKNLSSNFAPSATNMIPFRVTNSLGKFHMGVFDINGSYDDCSISYFSSYVSESSISWDTTVTFAHYCQGDTIYFDFDSVDARITRILGPNNYEIDAAPYLLTGVTPDNSGWYTVVASDSRGCIMEPMYDSIEITVHPSVESMVYDTVCPGDDYSGYGMYISADRTAIPGMIYDSITYQTAEFGCDSLLILELKVRDSVFGEFSKKACDQYIWNGQAYSEEGDYNQTLTDVHGCDSIVTLHLEIENPSVEIVTSGDDFCEYGELVLTAVSDCQEYRWSTGDTTSFISVTQPQTLYTLTVTQGDCEATAKFETPDCPLNIFLASAISPSLQDGKNDYLCLPEYMHRFISDFDIEIYNRWGEMVFKSNDINFRWYGNIDGNGKGTRVHISDVYVYVIHYERIGEQGKKYVKKGTVTVL